MFWVRRAHALVERVPISKLYDTQKSISRQFTDGRQFAKLFEDLLSDDVKLQHDERMNLEDFLTDSFSMSVFAILKSAALCSD